LVLVFPTTKFNLFRLSPKNHRVEYALEINIEKFVVEKSLNNKEFFAIAQVSAGQNMYAVIDGNPADGFNYYRLRIEEFGGKSSYSNVEAVNWGKGVYLNIYPNPAQDNLILQFRSFEQTSVSYRLFSQLGVEVAKGNLSLSANEMQRQNIQVAHLPKGVYFLEIFYGENRKLEKIVVQ
jgi:hypothetical protein